MLNYQTIKNNDDFLALMKQMYFASAKDVEEIELPKMKYLTFEGRGAPGSEIFQQAIQSLYGVAFTIKMGLKFGKLAKPADYFDYKMPPLESFWWQAGGWEKLDPKKWQWRLLIMLPPFISQSLFEEARNQALAKHPDIPYGKVKLEQIDEGKAIQLTHIGPYDQEKPTVDKLLGFAKAKHYRLAAEHHEIYMGDPRRTQPEKLKTVLRYAVKGKE